MHSITIRKIAISTYDCKYWTLKNGCESYRRNLRQYSGIFLEGLRKTIENYNHVVTVPAEIRMRHLSYIIIIIIIYWRAPQQILLTHHSLEDLLCLPMRKMMRFFCFCHLPYNSGKHYCLRQLAPFFLLLKKSKCYRSVKVIYAILAHVNIYYTLV
jgi:hypothetical protein